MRAIARRTSFIATLWIAAACGGGSDSVSAPVATSISVTGSTTGALVSVGDTRTLTALVRDANSAAIPNATLTWTTSNAAVATVAGSGLTAVVTATGNGTANIIATSGTVTGQIAVDVAQRFASLTVTAASTSLGTGATSQLTPVARDARGNAIAGAIAPTYTTGDRTRALVDSTGLVTAIAPGAATITAALTRDGVSANATANITVTAPSAGVNAVTVQASNANTFTPATATVNEGGTVTWSFGSVAHNVIFQGANAPANVGILSNTTADRTFATAGSFAYVCSLHAGMSGAVNVVAPTFFTLMNGANERPNPVPTSANGSAVFTRSGNTVTYTVAFQGIASAPTGLHIHAPANANTNTGIAVDLLRTTQMGPSGVLRGTFTGTDIRSVAGAPPVSLDSLMVLIRTGNAYVNVHSQAYLAGEIRGQTGPPL
jgi:plastocyanin